MDNAMRLLGDVRAIDSESRVPRLWARACRAAYRYGITGFHSVDGIDAFSWFQRLAAAGKLGLRVRYALPHDQLTTAETLRMRGGLGDDQFRVVALKVFSDGALGSQTAWMFQVYPDRPGYYGIPVCVGPELRDTIRRAAALDLPCWIHAIGDRAVHEVASALGTAGASPSRKRLLHRIEHAQCVRPKTVALMAKHKIIASVQPSHLCEDIPIADRHWRAVAKHAYPLRSLRSARILMAFGSDLPVETLNPYLGVYAAVTRRNRRGQPPEGWYPHHAIDRWTAVAGYTHHAAQSVGESDRLGRLVPGHYADFAVLSADPFRCRDIELPEIRASATYVGGERRHSG
jgi:predicted amidohydrolase YtcJ